MLLVLLVAAVLLAGAGLSGSWPGRTILVRSVCAVCAIVSAAWLAAGASSASLALPFGLADQTTVFAIDPVSLAFLPAVSIAAGAAGEPLAAAAGLLTVCAGDAALLVLGTGLAGSRGAGRTGAAMGLLVASALAFLRPSGGLMPQESLPALRVAGASAPVLLILFPVLWLARGRAGVIAQTLAAFLAVRVLLDLPGGVPFGWGLLLAAASLAMAVESGLRSIRAATLETVIEGLGGLGFAVGLSGLGVAAAARAADLPAVASASLAGALLMVLSLSLAVPLASLLAEEVAEQAGSRRFASLGGLAQAMPRTAVAAIVSLGTIAGLPPLAGFAPIWLIVQSLISAQRFGGVATPILLATLLASLGLAWGLGIVSAARLLALVFGGRPRTPRGAAALEARPRQQGRMAVLGAGLVLLALLAGPATRLFDPVVTALTGASMSGRAGPIALHAGSVSYAPLPVLLLIIAAPILLLRWGRRLRWRAASAWDGGAGPAPEWLPFGEPLAQPSGPGLARPVMALLGLQIAGLPGEGGASHVATAAARQAAVVALRFGRCARSALRRIESGLLAASPTLFVGLAFLVLAAAALRLAIGGRLG